MVASDAERASRFVADVFRQHVAPLYVAEGIAEFLAYASPDKFESRMLSRHVDFVAQDQSGELVGLVEIRDLSHVSFLFVSTARQRQSIGRTLLTEAIAYCRQANPRGATLTVNASPNSVSAYTRFGFSPTGPEHERSGIRFVPMEMPLQAPGGA